MKTLERSVVCLLGIILLLQSICGLPTDQLTDASPTEVQHEAMADILQGIHTHANAFGELLINNTRTVCSNMVRELKALPQQSDALQAIIMRYTDFVKQADDLKDYDLEHAERLAKTFGEIWVECMRMAKKSNLLEALVRAAQHSDIDKDLYDIQVGLLEFAKRFKEHLEKVFNAMTPAERDKYANIIALYEQYKAKDTSIQSFNNFVKNLKAEYNKAI